MAVRARRAGARVFAGVQHASEKVERSAVKILIAVLVAVGVVGTGITVGVMKYGSSNKTETTSVRVEPVGRGDLTEIVSAPGQVQPKTKVQISARVPARIAELPFEEGQSVRKGDPEANPPSPAWSARSSQRIAIRTP